MLHHLVFISLRYVLLLNTRGEGVLATSCRYVPLLTFLLLLPNSGGIRVPKEVMFLTGTLILPKGREGEGEGCGAACFPPRGTGNRLIDPLFLALLLADCSANPQHAAIYCTLPRHPSGNLPRCP